ncbi:hypothetical protein AB7645_05445 [Bradyrhizobium sp. 956_D2_N1_5]|uniref:hypothetical protein n=1 Tax=unclassified Bradyrhizobium TaxID=2631580 RepID=UPI003F1E4E9F
MIDVEEWVKIIGSLAGICSAIFLIRDRFTKHYPVAIMFARPIMENSRNIVHFLSVKNYSARPVIVTWEFENHNHLGLAKDSSVHGIVDSVFPGEKEICLGPDAEVHLQVIKPSNFRQIDPENSVQVRLRWRYAQPMLWKADRTIRVWMRKRDFDSIVENYVKPGSKDAT